MSSKDLADRYLQAIWAGDWETLGRLRHPDWTDTWPQSGEVVRGHDNWVRITENYEGGRPKWEVSAVHGVGETQVVTTPLVGPIAMPVTIMGGGDTFTAEGRLRYPDGEIYHVVIIGRIEEGKVIGQRTYFASPFDPPEWRREWVESEPRPGP